MEAVYDQQLATHDNYQHPTPMTKILAIETSCDETAAAVIVDYRIHIRGVPVRWRTSSSGVQSQ